MVRGFVAGLVWGGVVAGAGLAVISQVSPLPMAQAPGAVVAPEAMGEAAPETGAAPAATATPEATAAPEPSATPEPTATPEATATPEPSATPDATATPDVTAAPEVTPTAEVRVTPEVTPTPSAAAVPEATPSPSPALPKPAEAPQPQGLNAPQGSDSGAIIPGTGEEQPGSAALVVPAPAGTDAAPLAADPPPAPLDEALLQPQPDLPAPTILTPGSAALPGTAVKRIVPDGKPLTDAKPASDQPRIGTAEAPDPTAAPAPEAATPLALFSRAFDNPSAKPLFALILIDDGAPDLDRETLAALPFAVTFVLDPLAPGAAEAAAIYRAAGQEVMMRLSGLPQGATPADLEQSLQAIDMALPEAVAVLGDADALQQDRQLAGALVPIIGAQGRGVVTLDRGLDALGQVARREGVPAAAVFRVLDAEGESLPVIRRYLDRAAFRAAQEGAVVVLGTARPDTVAAILQWTVEGRASAVALAPISAVLSAP